MLWTAWNLGVRLKWTSECGHNILHPTFQAGLLEDTAFHRLYMQESENVSYMQKAMIQPQHLSVTLNLNLWLNNSSD